MEQNILEYKTYKQGCLYLSHLLNFNSSYTFMSYSEFCKRWSCTQEDVLQRDYTNIRWAIKDYMRSSINNITDICPVYRDPFIFHYNYRQNNGTLKGHNHRTYDRFCMSQWSCPTETIVQRYKYCLHRLGISFSFKSLFYSKTNNYTLM